MKEKKNQLVQGCINNSVKREVEISIAEISTPENSLPKQALGVDGVQYEDLVMWPPKNECFY